MKHTLLDDMGRNDPDLTPEHDRAMLWLERDLRENFIPATLDRHYSEREPTLKDLITQDMRGNRWIDTPWRKLNEEDLKKAVEKVPLIRKGQLRELRWEHPLNDGWLFLDLLVTIEQNRPVYRSYQWLDLNMTFNFGFEVKPRVWSIGQTLRQLKTYARHFDGYMFLVAPAEDDLIRVIRQEHFNFYRLPESF